MTNIEKYKKAFTESLGINLKDLKDSLKYNDIPEWDSIGHMTLISNLEDAFNITIETDDIVDFSSFKKGIEILKKQKIII
jgi:acyl carrier protein|tara:strand:+ start:215 stop:454 length:240 start_codon:yes stop_codon:yes gene_type:complete